jgi:hypothetical protein
MATLEDLGEFKPNRSQLAAIDNLELALARCAMKGVALVGMDDQLLAFDAAELLKVREDPRGDHHEGYRRIGSILVKDSGAYVDSGGW